MLHHIEVTNFRGLAKFRMEQLGRVNLLVGTNNCGKTSVLEAISILMNRGSADALWHSLWRRGEMHDAEGATEIEIGHLFHGHRLDGDATFTINGKNGDSSHHVEARVAPANPSSIRRLLDGNHEALGDLDLALSWIRGDRRQELTLPITQRGGLLSKYREHSRYQDDSPTFGFVTTEALNREEVMIFLEEIVLTPEEDTVLAALRTIEPSIERIAPVGGTAKQIAAHERGGVVVKLAGQRVPIGSLGDGIWRLLGIALALVRARGGVLLVDEIDTGLHYSVLERMWHLVYETAKRLDVQVFATTHSRDCYESLAAIARPTGHDVTIQRIERGKQLAVAFSEAEIVQAAKRGIEVR